MYVATIHQSLFIRQNLSKYINASDRTEINLEIQTFTFSYGCVYRANFYLGPVHDFT